MYDLDSKWLTWTQLKGFLYDYLLHLSSSIVRKVFISTGWRFEVSALNEIISVTCLLFTAVVFTCLHSKVGQVVCI